MCMGMVQYRGGLKIKYKLLVSRWDYGSFVFLSSNFEMFQNMVDCFFNF